MSSQPLYGRLGSAEHARLRRACELLLHQCRCGELVVLLDEVAWFLDTTEPGKPLNPALHERLHKITHAAIGALLTADAPSGETGGGR